MLDFDEIFTDSYERLLDLGGVFFSKFYENFISASPEVKKKFQNTDMQKQKKMLRMSISHMLEFYLKKQDTEHMHEIADIHSKRDKDISPQFYDLWLETLVATVRELDPKYDRDVGLAWKMVMSAGIMYMKDIYDRNGKPNQT